MLILSAWSSFAGHAAQYVPHQPSGSPIQSKFSDKLELPDKYHLVLKNLRDDTEDCSVKISKVRAYREPASPDLCARFNTP
eukprot:SAG22_NODE_20_length_32168_cov_40.859241_9_plen_81_part_00